MDTKPDSISLTKIQAFLSVVCADAVPRRRSEAIFLNAFPPELIMKVVEDDEVRANILFATVVRHIETARLLSKDVAGIALKKALEAKNASPEVVLELFTPDLRARYLHNPDLWAFIIGGEDAVHAQTDKDATACILEAAIAQELVTPEEVVRAIGFETFFKEVEKADVVIALEKFADKKSGGFNALLEIYPPKRIVINVSLDVIWNKVVLPLIAIRHGLTSAEKDAKKSAEPPATESKPFASAAPITGETKPGVPASPPAATTIARPSVSTTVSHVPAAARLHDSAVLGQGSGKPDPKVGEASVATGSDAEGDDDGQVVTDEDLEKDDKPLVADENPQTGDHSSPEVIVHNLPSDIAASSSPIAADRKEDDPLDDESSWPNASPEPQQPFPLRRTSSSSGLTATPQPIARATHPPRPAMHEQPHPNSRDSGAQIEVGEVDDADSEIRAALLDEPPDGKEEHTPVQVKSHPEAAAPNTLPSQSSGAPQMPLPSQGRASSSSQGKRPPPLPPTPKLNQSGSSIASQRPSFPRDKPGSEK